MTILQIESMIDGEQSMRVLVVDDNKNDVMILRTMLQSRGYDIYEAGNGFEALEQVNKEIPDIIISDIMMPEMDGFRLLRSLKENKITKNIPFIFYTANYGCDEDKKLGLALGASRYLLKPLKPAELLDEIEAVLKKFEADELKPAEPAITDEEYLRKYSERLSLKLESNLKKLQEEIEKRKEVEEVLRIEKEHLESAIKAKSEFLASMSHELKTPLISILGFTQILTNKNSGELTDKQKHFIESIRKSGDFLLSLINDILDLSKIEAGKIELNTKEIPLKSTIEETLTLFYEKALKHKIVIKKEFEPGLDLIEADKQRVKQILINLLSNAVKFSKEEGGTITITVKKAGDNAQISVSDTGIGIKPENLGKLFRKFEQLDKGISQKYGGTGLGLSITKQLVELHGGTITAESRYGEGSTFTFTLPIEAKKRD